MTSKSKIIDSFPYNGEKEVLDIRLHELDDIVDKFIIIESNKTQTGLPKPYHFDEQKEYFSEFLNKIVYVKLNDDNLSKVNEGDWKQEFRVRRAALEGLEKIRNSGTQLFSDDVLLINDVDEIPRKEVLSHLVYEQKEDLLSLNHYFNSYYLNWYSNFRNWGWYGTVICRLSSLQLNDIQQLRNNKDNLRHTGRQGEGWHFSNLLVRGFHTMYDKWVSNIEPHEKSVLFNKDQLAKDFEKCVYEDGYFFYCDQVGRRDIKLQKLPLDSLPEYVIKNIDKFTHIIKV